MSGKPRTGVLSPTTVTLKGDQMFLLPPAEGLCQVCATRHEPHLPHNFQSLYYRMAFQMKVGRPVTWNDAWAHCPDTIKDAWRETLLRLHPSQVEYIDDSITPVNHLGEVPA